MVDSVSRTGSGSARPFGERRVVTALFCDVVNSTTMAEQLDPEDWTEIMNGAFERLTAPIERYGGTINKLMGDAVLAFFGMPAAHEDDPERAVLAALAMVAAIRPYREEIRARFRLDFNVRVGINTGPVVVAHVGSARVTDHTAMGDAVNVAARMEHTAAAGTVQVSADTWRLVAPLFEAEALGPIALKGKSDPVEAYRVIASRAQPGRLRGIPGVSARLVGRDRELGLFREAMARVEEGRGQVVCLIGEAGLGKSRLLSEACAEWRERRPDGQWDVMTGIPYDAHRPYGLFQNFARFMFGVDLEDSAPVVHQRIQGWLRGRGASEDEVALCSVAFQRVIAAKILAEAPDYPGEVIRRDIYDSMYPALRGQAMEQPRVIVVDDLQWADRASVDLLLHLMQMVDETPIMFVCAFRPERQSPAWLVKQKAETDFHHRYTEIVLQPLGSADTDALVSELLTIADLPGELRQLILRKAEGNPYFVEEIVRTLIDDGVVYRTGDGLHWRSDTKVADIAIPDGLQALLMARIDRLDQETKATLQLASVIGRSFYYRILKAISDKAMALDRHLGSLERTELVREAGRQPELEYMFRHELARDAAYGSILNRRRRDFHRQVGEAIEAIFADRLEEQAHRLAQHFTLAGDSARALRYLEMAGDTATGLNADDEGLTHFTRAIDAAREVGAEADVIARLEGKKRALAVRAGATA